MRRAQWVAPEEDPTAVPAADSATVLRALAQALGEADPRPWELAVERQRISGRSRMFVVAGTSGDATARWVVKEPFTDWTQDDLGNPLTAQQELAALQRLHEHFAQSPSPYRVPRPVALLPEIDAFAMEHITGPNLKDMLTYGSVVRPAPLLGGLEAAGRFLRELHDLEELPSVQVDLRDEAQRVLAVAEEKLHPLGLDLPERVRRTLADIGSQEVEARQVWLHGDFGPSNVLLADDGTIVGIDPSLDVIGQPEDDLVRFVALVSGIIRLAPEVAAPPLARVRRELESRLLRSYYGTDTWPLLYEVRYLHQLARRWCRLRELAQQNARSALRFKLAVITQQVRLLMLESESRLARGLEGRP